MKTTLEKKYDFSHEALCDDKKRKQLYDDCEAEVLSRLESKTAVGVAGAMIGFFRCACPDEKRFKREAACAEQVLNELKSCGMGNWGDFELRLNRVYKSLRHVEDYALFWGVMLSIWKRFPGDPRKAAWLTAKRARDNGQLFEDAHRISGVTYCTYCWRTVPARLGWKKGRVCPMHDFDSGSNDLVRRQRMLKKLGGSVKDKRRILQSPKVRGLLSFFRPWRRWSNPYANGHGSRLPGVAMTTWDEEWYSNPSGVLSFFPFVSRYLSFFNVDYKSRVSIVRALNAFFIDGECVSDVQCRLDLLEFYDGFMDSVGPFLSVNLFMNNDVMSYLEENDVCHVSFDAVFKHYFSIVESNEDLSDSEMEFMSICERYIDYYNDFILPQLNTSEFICFGFDRLVVDARNPWEAKWGLERLGYPHMSDDFIPELKEFYRLSDMYFDVFYEHLVLAEVWLECEANYSHGGRRKGSGRKAQK